MPSPTTAVPALCVLLLINVYSVAQKPEYLDSLNSLAKSYACQQIDKSDSISDAVIAMAEKSRHQLAIAYALKNKAQNQSCRGDFLAATSNLNRAVTLFKQYGDTRGKAEAYNNLATAYRNLSKIDSAKLYNSRHLKIALALEDSVLLMAAYSVKSGIHTALAENDSIIFYAIKGLAIAEKTNDLRFNGIFTLSIGNAYYQDEDYEPALKYYSKAKGMLEGANNERVLNAVYHNIASCNSKLNQLDTAFVYFEKAINLSQKLGNKYNLAYNYQGFADACYNKGDYEKAIQYNLLSRDISIELNEKRSLAAVLSNLAACYTKTRQPKLAIESASQAADIDREIGDLDKEADAYWLLSEAYLSEGDHESALAAFKKFYSIDSVLLSKEKIQTIFEMEARYQSEKKDLEIGNLSQQAAIKDLEIQQKNQAMVIGLLVVFFVAGTVYFANRQRTLKNMQAQTELEQRFLRSQLNPHFMSNALMAVQAFTLKNQPEKAASYLAKFAKLMREILEHSRQEFILVEDEVQMLRNYLDIHRLRMNESFDYSIEVDESIDLETDSIPPMFVQPFIENAIEHGVTNARGKGMINVKLVKESDFIAIEITDNGGGMIQEAHKIKGHHSLSTTIIQERMALLNKSMKKKIGLVWGNLVNESGEINGTRVELKVPYSYL